MIDMNAKVPIFRALKRSKKVKYLIGELGKGELFNDRIFINNKASHYETLAINMPDMKDKNNKDLFCSFNKDGIGGDIFIENGNANIEYVAVFFKGNFMAKQINSYANYALNFDTLYSAWKTDYPSIEKYFVPLC